MFSFVCSISSHIALYISSYLISVQQFNQFLQGRKCCEFPISKPFQNFIFVIMITFVQHANNGRPPIAITRLLTKFARMKYMQKIELRYFSITILGGLLHHTLFPTFRNNCDTYTWSHTERSTRTDNVAPSKYYHL